MRNSIYKQDGRVFCTKDIACDTSISLFHATHLARGKFLMPTFQTHKFVFMVDSENREREFEIASGMLQSLERKQKTWCIDYCTASVKSYPLTLDPSTNPMIDREVPSRRN